MAVLDTPLGQQVLNSVDHPVLGCTTPGTPPERNHTLLRLLSAFLVVASLFLVSPAQAQSLCYAVADSGDTLVSMNSDGTNFTSIGNTGTANIESIAMQPGVPNTLFAADAGQFGEINLSTGAFTAIGSGIGTGTGTDGSINLNDIDSLAFDLYTGILWGVHRRAPAEDVLIQIDHTTGTFIPNVFSGSACGATSPCDYVVVKSNVSPINHGDIDDISIYPASGIMYAIANGGGVGDRLVQIDMQDGTVTDVGPLGVDDMEGFSQFNDGTLYGTTGNNGPDTALNNSLWSIDISTGAATHIAQFGSGSDYESVSCLTEDGNVIRGTVFNDTANLGTFDGGEAGLAGITVQLYIDENNDGVVDSGDTLVATRTTDSNGEYQFNLGVTDNFVLAIDTATIPSGGSLSTDNVEEADFSTYGNTDNNNDFGIELPPALTLTKTSDAPSHLVAAGDTITYTVQIQNTSSVDQTGLSVSDPLPANTSYVAQSTSATGTTVQTETYADQFDTAGSYAGSNGSRDWSTSPWTEINESDGPASGDEQVVDDDDLAGTQIALRIRDNDGGGEGVQRISDLSGAISASLSFDFRRESLDDSADYIDLIITNGSSSLTDRFQGPADESAYQPISYDLSSLLPASTLTIQFVTSSSLGGNDELWVDNLVLSAQFLSSITKTNQASDPNPLLDGVPSNLISSGDTFMLTPGASMTVTFQVQVDDPLDPAVTQLTNLVSATSAQQLAPLSASVTDYVPHLASYEGDNAGISTYTTLDELYYRDPSNTGQAETAVYTGGLGYPADTAFDVVYYDADGVLVFTDTDAASDSSGFLGSAYTIADGLDTTDQTFAYGLWTAVVIPDGASPPATLAAVNASNSILSDTFEVRSWSTTEFTDSSGNPVDEYNVPGGDNTAYLTVSDPDANTDPGLIDSITVTITDSETGDSITVTLYETGVDTGIFTNNSSGSRLGVPLEICATPSPDPDPNTLCVTADSFLNATYTDPSDNNDASNDAVTNPVTLRSFSSIKGEIEGHVIFEWSTATEVGNLGFDLYVQQGRQWVRINTDPIASPVIDSLEVTDYTYDASGVTGNTFQLVDIDITGKEARHGPFTLGKHYGQSDSAERINWRAIKQQNTDKKRQRRARRQNELRQTSADLKALNLLVNQDGIQRVTYEQLAEAGLDLQGVKIEKLALLNRGTPVPMWVAPRAGQTGKNLKFGPGGAIEFLGHKLDSLYTKTNVYTLKVQQAQAVRVEEDVVPPLAVTPESYYLETTQISPEAWYSFAAPNGDPWYAEQLLAWGGPYAQSFDIYIDEYLAGAAPASVSVGLWGVTDWPSQNDHHVRVRFNGTQVGDERFDGLSNHPVHYGLPTGSVQEGPNSITLELPLDTGELFDLVNVDHWQVTYPRRFRAKAGQLTFTASGQVFAVEGLSGPDIVVYRVHGTGTIERLMDVQVEDEDLGGHYRARFRGLLDPATYYVTSTNLLTPPELEPLPPKAKITKGNAHYLIIAHPDFIDANLDAFAAAKKAQGFKQVKIVDVEDIYAEFGHSIVDPQAIRDFIAHAAQQMQTQMVLFVGGDTYDYHDYLGLGAVSFIPSLYAQTDPIVHYAPVDAKYVDLDNDNVPDLPVGRLPVRTSEDLAVILAKTQAYEQQQSQTALFAADVFDEFQNYSFTADSDAMLAMLPLTWTATKAYSAEVGIEAARTIILDTLEAGVAWTNFTGHSGPIHWTFRGLFNSADAATLSNATKPTVVTQWGCWNTYYVSPFENTLGHTFMLNPNGGAAAVLGASTLTGAHAERELAIELYARLFTPGKTLGEAVLEAKQAYAQQAPQQLDVLLGWTLLGDPALVIQP